MEFTQKKKQQHKRQLSQLNDTLNGFVIGNNINVSAVEDENLEPQTNSRFQNFGRVTLREDSACQGLVFENNIDDKIRKAVDDAVNTVEYRMLDAILTAMDNVVVLRIEVVVRSITQSSGRALISIVQNPDQKDVSGNTENTLFMSATS